MISASHVQKAAAFAMWPKPQNRQNNMIFDEYGLPYHTSPITSIGTRTFRPLIKSISLI
jgi:hypothetical protein